MRHSCTRSASSRVRPWGSSSSLDDVILLETFCLSFMTSLLLEWSTSLDFPGQKQPRDAFAAGPLGLGSGGPALLFDPLQRFRQRIERRRLRVSPALQHAREAHVGGGRAGDVLPP